MRLKKLLAMLLTVVLLVSSTVIALPVSADGNATWEYKTGTLTGTGTEQDPYIIATAQDLATLAYIVKNESFATAGKYFEQTADIDLANIEWTGIDTFNGTYDGKGHVVKNLKLDADTGINGLFAKAAGATIKNVGIASGESNVTLSGGGQIGALVGFVAANSSLTVSNCFNMSSLTIKVGGTSFVGGLLGDIQSPVTITNCWNTGDVTVNMDAAQNVAVGGIAGRLHNSLTVTNCHTLCDIYVEDVGKANVWDGIGSFVGKCSNNVANKTITNSFAGGTVTVENAAGATQEYTAIFVGFREGSDADKVKYTNCTYDVVCTKGGNAVTNEVHNGMADGVAPGKCNMFVNNAVQNGTVDGNSIRFVTELTLGTAGFVKTGFTVSVTYNGTTKSKPLEGAVVYSSLLADGGTEKPDEGNVFIAYGIKGIPADADATFTVTPYVVAADGTTFYGAEVSVEMVDGDVPNPNA